MSYQEDRLKEIADAIREKEGSTAPIVATEFADRIKAIETGIDTSDATATATDIARDKTAYVQGQKVTGDVYVINSAETFSAIPDSGTISPLQNPSTKQNFFQVTGKVANDSLLRQNSIVSTMTDATKFGEAQPEEVLSGRTFTSSAGLKLEGTLPSATQATPSINVSSSGLITASVTQSEGYVEGGTKSATKQLTTKAETVITPGTSAVTAVAKNVYTTGAVTVAGDSNLTAANIKQGVSIFGTTGTYTSDATATATDIVSGKTAYVKGQKISGSRSSLNAAYTSSVTQGGGYIYNNLSTGASNWYVPSNSTLTLLTSKSEFGNATATDVASGKTFTSSAGLKVTGTAGSSSTTPCSVTITNNSGSTLSVNYIAKLFDSTSSGISYVNIGNNSSSTISTFPNAPILIMASDQLRYSLGLSSASNCTFVDWQFRIYNSSSWLYMYCILPQSGQCSVTIVH